MIVTLKYSPGDKVRIINAGIDAVVNKVIIERGAIIYELEWWDENKTMHCMTFYSQEIETPDNCKENTLQIVQE